MTIFNTSDITIENWELSYQSADEYVNIWNASVDYRGAKYYNIKNAGHNQNIRPGESVSFGFQAAYKGESMDIPKSYKILGDRLVVNNKECQIQFDVVNQWNNGCIMNATLYNNSDKNIEDWSMACRSILTKGLSSKNLMISNYISTGKMTGILILTRSGTGL